MAIDNLLATLENTLRQTRSSRSRLTSRLLDVEREAQSLKAEIAEMDMLAAQTESSMYRFMSAVFGGGQNSSAYSPAPQEQRYTSPEGNVYTPLVSPISNSETPPVVHYVNNNQPGKDQENAVKETVYANLTIPQATAALLRDAGGPLHVNDIYEQLLAGGFVFSGHNPTISIAVSLTRNPRFRKVSPGTFALVLRDVAA